MEIRDMFQEREHNGFRFLLLTWPFGGIRVSAAPKPQFMHGWFIEVLPNNGGLFIVLNSDTGMRLSVEQGKQFAAGLELAVELSTLTLIHGPLMSMEDTPDAGR